MKNPLFLLFFFNCFISFGQNITVDHDSYTPQELIENILINSDCIENINVTGSVTGNFNNNKSYGYFDNNNSNFPFENGIVMSTGKLSNVPGPNDHLSDDDAPGWGPDQDLEQILGMNNTHNATVIEFDFTPNANTIQFRYIFASEEYQIGDSSTCDYSDVFGFLIKPIGGSYQNIAVVPGTNTPVKVTTVHPQIIDGNNGCPAQNEQYFESFNGVNHSIGFNGQTKPLTARATVIAGTTYHIKLVIADDHNYRYDSAVFLEGNSFNIGANLGEDITGSDALCEGETHNLSITNLQNTPTNYNWYLINDDNTETLLASGANEDEYEVTQGGTYKVVVTFTANCTAEDTIEIEYIDFTSLSNRTVSECNTNSNGTSVFNLTASSQNITNNNPNFTVTNYFLTEAKAEANVNPIPNSNNFPTTEVEQTVFARVEANSTCFTLVELTLETSFTAYNPVSLVNCYSIEDDAISFNLNNAEALISNESGLNEFSVTYFYSEDDALTNTNSLSSSIEVSPSELPQTVYGKLQNPTGCQGIIKVILKGITSPEINANYKAPFLCLENLDGVTVEAGILGNSTDYNFLWENGETTPTIQVDSLGTYQVEISKTEMIDGESFTCSTTNSITVDGSEKAEFTYDIQGNLDQYNVVINTNGVGSYVYSLDDQFGDYQTSNIFQNVRQGAHKIYVKDLNGCGISSKDIMILGYPKFFTPNQDGFNDTWGLIGTQRFNRKIEFIYIFDRFGKLLTSIAPTGRWDGTYNGKQMPSTDYWFLVTFKDAPDFKGHFTLKR
ncbi:T9SS type B sorting domain-containing protein [Mesonia aestuariivivens]|uniref:T9SS type B sorting domain-containing protein n=1 Tax=Mesonia aestuariivivens TaxID=2796128 RepID=A0ABS6W0K4_9FLAO|nr:choice-of-anchor L domain-containing protein [Mesonia aestuariivivens]MBW2961371.1 T9SS type B sorting domain-containing protein [Mesonia aestuariivivens]